MPIPYDELGLQQKEAAESAERVLDEAFFDVLCKHRHACYSQFSPLKRHNICGCYCGRHYHKGGVLILELGPYNTPECQCHNRGVC